MCVDAPTLFSIASMVYFEHRITSEFARTSTKTKRGIIMNKDQVKGRVQETKGKIKEVAGKILDDEDMELEGTVQKNVGKVQSGFGDLKEDIKKVAED